LTALVLDSSAVLAVIRGEPGAGAVAEALAEAVISAVNLSEVVSVLTRDGMTRKQVGELLTELSLDVEVFDEAQAIAAGELIALTEPSGLSLGDRACLALARSLALPVLTADRPWRRLPPIEGLEVRFIR